MDINSKICRYLREMNEFMICGMGNNPTGEPKQLNGYIEDNNPRDYGYDNEEIIIEFDTLPYDERLRLISFALGLDVIDSKAKKKSKKIAKGESEEYKCFFCGKFANYSLYLAGNIKELCAEHFRKAGQKTVVVRGKK